VKNAAFNVPELEVREFLNLDETAAVLGVSVGTLTVEVRSGRLEIIRLGQRGRRIVIPRTARQRWLERNLTEWRSADGA
jgi:excisionase family DNA binding protein